MTRFTRAVPLAAIALAVLASTACKPKPVETVTPVGSPNADSAARAEAERRRADSVAAANAERDRRAREIAQRRADSIANAERMASSARAELTNSMVAMIHYNYDQADILDGDRPVLDRKAAIMAANPGVRIRISGHADERGSDEYNMALSQRRAAAAKRYLESRGVTSDRIEIISLGEERPICESHEESCWAQNRRGEFEIIAGGGNLMAPR